MRKTLYVIINEGTPLKMNRSLIDHGCRIKPALDLDRQTFPAELVEDIQRPERFPIIGPAMHEVVAPDMVAILGP